MTNVRRAVLVGVALALVLSCGAAGYGARNGVAAALVLPGASQVEATWRGVGSLDLRYRSVGAPFEWRDQLSRKLRSQGWVGRSYTNVGAQRPPFSTIWFTRQLRIGPLALEERVVLGGEATDPRLAVVQLARELRVDVPRRR